MNNNHKNEQAEDLQSCNLTREQGRKLVIKSAEIIRKGNELIALGAKASAEGWLQLFFLGASKFFYGIEEDGYKDFV